VRSRPAGAPSAPRGGPCTRETKRCEFWTWSDRYVRPDCCTDHLRELATFVNDLLERHRILHWVDYGTLLGAVRDGAFIPWDEDVDFGILAHDLGTVRALEPEITAAGYEMDASRPETIRINYSAANHQHVDLFNWSESDGVMTTEEAEDYEWPGMHGRSSFPSSYLERLETVELYGRPYPAPSPVHRFLVEHRFRPDYMTPRRGVLKVGLYPDLRPEELTPLVEELFDRLAERERRLLQAHGRLRLGHVGSWRRWIHAGLPRSPSARFLQETEASLPEGERTAAVDHLVRSIALLDQALQELGRPTPAVRARRVWRRALRVREAVAARRAGRPTPALPYADPGR